MSVLGVERGGGQPTTEPCVQRRHDVVLCARPWVQCGGEGTLWVGYLGRVGAVVRQRSSCGGTSWGSHAKGIWTNRGEGRGMSNIWGGLCVLASSAASGDLCQRLAHLIPPTMPVGYGRGVGRCRSEPRGMWSFECGFHPSIRSCFIPFKACGGLHIP